MGTGLGGSLLSWLRPSLLFTAYSRDHLLLKAFLFHSLPCYQPLDIPTSPFNPRCTSFLPYPCLCGVVDEISVFLLLRGNCRAFIQQLLTLSKHSTLVSKYLLK